MPDPVVPSPSPEIPPAPIFPDPPPDITNKPWWITFAVLVRNTVAMIAAIGIIPAASADRTTALILGVVAFGALAASEAVVLWRWFRETANSKAHTQQLRADVYTAIVGLHEAKVRLDMQKLRFGDSKVISRDSEIGR